MVISRKEWGARHEDGFGPAPEPATEVWLHHTVTIAPDVGWLDANNDGLDDSEVKAIRQIEAIGEQRFGRGISYNRLVVPAGRIYGGVSWNRKGAHLGGRNSIARSYALVGNYDLERVTDAQVDAIARDLVQAWRAGHLDAPVLDGGHGSAPGAATACPGRNGREAIPRIWTRIAEILTPRPPAPPPTPEDDDMSPEQHRALILAVTAGRFVRVDKDPWIPDNKGDGAVYREWRGTLTHVSLEVWSGYAGATWEAVRWQWVKERAEELGVLDPRLTLAP